MKNLRHQHTPTRRFPHWLCGPLHSAAGLLAVIDLIILLTTGTGGASLGGASGFWTYTIAVLFVCYGVSRIALGSSMREVDRLDQRDRQHGVLLVVRPVWATIAAAMDGLVVTYAVAVGALSLAAPSPVAGPAPGQGQVLTGMLATIAVVFARRFAHRQAARPAKPKRAAVGALAESGA